MKKIVIIGAGASGMMAAIAAAEENPGAKIQIIEHKDIPGKKILSTGNGKCNFTNQHMDASCFYSDHPKKISTVLEKFGTPETLQFFLKLGILPKDRNGYYYPRSDQAAAVISVFRIRLKQLGVSVNTNVHVTGVKKKNTGFLIFTDEKTYESDVLILACGGKAAPVLGSDGSGYDLAKSLGHHMTPVVPALVQLKTVESYLKAASGVRTEARVSFLENGICVAEDIGELQVTAYGISGIPVFQISRCAAKAIYYKRQAEAQLDFLPQLEVSKVETLLMDRKKGREALSMDKFLVGIFPQKLISCILRYAKIREQTKVEQLTYAQLEELIKACKQMRLTIADTNGFEQAQVCAGGIRLDEVDLETMQSLCCEKLYLAGELLDVDGICGGYNLQWAWSSGYLAGKSAGRME